MIAVNAVAIRRNAKKSEMDLDYVRCVVIQPGVNVWRWSYSAHWRWLMYKTRTRAQHDEFAHMAAVRMYWKVEIWQTASHMTADCWVSNISKQLILYIRMSDFWFGHFQIHRFSWAQVRIDSRCRTEHPIWVSNFNKIRLHLMLALASIATFMFPMIRQVRFTLKPDFWSCFVNFGRDFLDK